MRKSLGTISLLVGIAVGISSNGCSGTKKKNDNLELLSVVAISRHGIRSQTQPLNTINEYTLRQQGFPLWPAPADIPGRLSTYGQENVARLGGWYRDFYTDQGLLPPRGTCPADKTVFVYADNMERTIQTAQGYLDGMFQGEATPDCAIQVVHSSQTVDPYFEAIYGLCKVDSAVDQAAFNAKVGGDPSSLIGTYSAQLQALQTVTQCCQPAACVSPENPSPVSCSLLDLPSTSRVNALTGAVDFGPLFDMASTITETFQLEYAQAMPDTNCALTSGAQCVGWGAIEPGGLDELMKLHTMYFDLMYRLPSFAQAASSNLMWQLAGTMDQALSGVKGAGILAPTQSKFTLFVGHDVNITAIAAYLGGLTWKAEGFQQNDPDPAGALVFELYRSQQSNQTVVKAFFVTATLEQMRNGTELSLKTPPQRVALTIPACGGLDCSYDQFKNLITSNIRQDCLVKSTSP